MILGISTDKIEEQVKFAKRDKLLFPLFADADKKASKAYGVLSERGFANRQTFVIDKKGVLRKVYTTVKPADNAGEVLKYIEDELNK